MRKFYTTGQTAKMMGVSCASVQRWANTGMLKTSNIPGSRHRRVLDSDLLEFLVRHKQPIPPELKEIPS